MSDISVLTTCATVDVTVQAPYDPFHVLDFPFTQSDLDIPRLSLCASSEELLVSLNTQIQTPDDPQYDQNPQGVPRDLFGSSLPFNQVLLRFSTNYHILPLRLPIVTQNIAHLLPSRLQKTPNQGF